MITIVPITDHEVYQVNGKEIYKDSNGNWIAREEFTQQERNAFTNYKKAVISNPNFKKHPKATYKINTMSDKMSNKRQMQYYVKIAGALNTLFEEDSENYINVFAKDFNANDFIHVLATRVPQMVVAKLTNNEFDPLEFNHVCNRLIMQDRIDNNKDYTEVN